MVADTMNFFAKNFLGYHIIDQSRHTVNKLLRDKSTHAAVNSKLLKKFDHFNNLTYELDLAKAQIGHKKPITVGFFLS